MKFTGSCTKHHEDQGVMTVILACLLIYGILSFVSSVTDEFVEDVSLLYVSSSLCGGGWAAKEFVKINSWELNSHFYLMRPNFLNPKSS